MLKTLVNITPTDDLWSMDRMFERLFAEPFRPTPQIMSLPIDITERDGTLTIKAAVPGIDPKDLDVTVENGLLTIKGEIRNETQTENDKVYRREVAYGHFHRAVSLPENLDVQKIQATFKNGFVSIDIPRLPDDKPAAIKVDVRAAE